jgi:site-specific DNA-methyltransferase (adenine-specific)/modification methylase
MRVEKIGAATLYLGDCLEVLPTLGKVDAVVTDPPYGCGKAAWDVLYPTEWYQAARVVASRIVIITGSAGIRDSVRLIGDDFRDVIAARNLNGMTRGPLGFSNWIAAVVGGDRPEQGINAFDFTVSGDMPDHPSPKPIQYMLRLIDRVTIPYSTILDPFMGSGTTGVACANLGRKFIGIEIEEKYFDIACRRIADAYKQPRLFDDCEIKQEIEPTLF